MTSSFSKIAGELDFPRPEYIVPPYATPFARQQMTRCDIPYIHHIQSGIDIRRHLPAHKINDDFACRRRFPSHGRRLVLSDSQSPPESVLSELERHLLRPKFRALIGAVHVPLRHRLILVTDAVRRGIPMQPTVLV